MQSAPKDHRWSAVAEEDEQTRGLTDRRAKDQDTCPPINRSSEIGLGNERAQSVYQYLSCNRIDSPTIRRVIGAAARDRRCWIPSLNRIDLDHDSIG